MGAGFAGKHLWAAAVPLPEQLPLEPAEWGWRDAIPVAMPTNPHPDPSIWREGLGSGVGGLWKQMDLHSSLPPALAE